MTSPSKNHSLINSEGFSPVKIPGSLTPLARSHTLEREKVSGILHGSIQKQENRRNTIHHNPITRRKFVETPLKSGLYGLGKDAVNVISLTSPRLNKGKKVNLESLSVSKEKLESKLIRVTNKENANPFKSSSPAKRFEPSKLSSTITISSPIKRNNEDSYEQNTNKIARIITNAEDSYSQVSRDSGDHADHSIQIDEMFVKEDLIGRMNAEKSSPIKEGRKADTRENNAVVIDNDSDSDPEDYGRIENTISQTIVGNNSINKDSMTQLSKIIKLDKFDYITPQRYTEPVARSPSTNQHIRINDDLDLEEEIGEKIESKDITSPLKSHKISEVNNETDEEFIENNLENEPTINFLMSPNSKPVFSVDQITKIQDDFSTAIDNLQKVISDKNQEIVKINQDLASSNSKLLMYEQEVKELSQLKKNFLSKEEILYIQLKHNEREMASLTKNFKIKENTLNHLELRCSKDKSIIDSLVTQLNSKNADNIELQNDIENLREEIVSTKTEQTKKIDMLKTTISQKDLELDKLSKIKLEISEKNNEIVTLKNTNLESNHKIESLLREKEDLWKSLETHVNEKSDLNNKLQEERDLNLRQEELVKELDKLENLAKDRILSLETSLKNKDSEIETLKSQYENSELEKNQLVDMCDKLERENSRVCSELSKTQNEITTLNERLTDNDGNATALHARISNLEEELKHSKNLVRTSQSEHDKLIEVIKESEKKIKILTESNQEKDSTIIEDTKRMNELVNAVDQQKSNYENKVSTYQEEIQSLKAKMELNPSLSEENEFLRKQIKSSEAMLEKKISEVATYLHQEYAEKHLKKLREVKDKYEKEIGVSSIEKKSLQREIESLKRKLIRANEDCQRVNEFVHLNKLNYIPSNMANSLSPKKSNGKNRY